MRRRPWIPVLAGALTILASSIAPIMSTGARAASTETSVKAWIEINTTRPAVGCMTTFVSEPRFSARITRFRTGISAWV